MTLHWTMPSHYLNQCCDIVNMNLRNKLQWNFKWNLYIFIQENPFQNAVWKMAAILSWPQCANHNCCVDMTNLIGNKLALQWRHNGCNGVSNYQPHVCLFNRLFRCRSKKLSKLRVIGLYVGNSPVTGEFPAQRASNAENVSIWWRHHGMHITMTLHCWVSGKLWYLQHNCVGVNIT